MSYNVEVGFISKLLQTKDILSVKDSQITLEYFSGESKAAYQFIQDSVLSNGEVPTVRVFQRKFPRYTLETVDVEGEITVGTEENLKFWCDELRKKKKHNSLADSVTRVAELLSSYNTDDAYSELKQVISYVETEITETSDVDLTKNTEDRIQSYLKRKENRGMRGIPTGFSHLDNILKGLEKETLTTIIALTGVGKALTVATPVLTEDGFIPMKDIKVGTRVCASNGKFYNVSAIYPQGKLPVYRVLFEDGTHVDCCKDHLWKFKTVDDVSRKKEWRVKTLEQILKDHPVKRGKTYNISIPVSSPVQFSGNQLPIDPYVLGCLLGDGGFTTDRISFSSANPDHVEYLNHLLADWGEFTSTTDKNYSYNFKSWSHKENKLYRAIKRLGLIGCKSDTKFVPDIYLNSSYEDRLALIQGLIDTDGSIDSKGSISYFTGSEKLKDAFVYLARSIGKRCYIHRYTRDTKNLPEFKVTVSAKDESLYRSAHRAKQWGNRVVPKRVNHYGHLKIVGIEALNHEEEMQCITVDSPDHTFICGDFIVTHNTWIEIIIGARCQLQNCRVLQFVTEMSEEIMRDRYEAILFAMYHEGFSYNAFKSGTLEPEIEQAFFDFLRDDLPTFEPLIIATASGVMGIAATIEKYKPDIVLIDSAYLMEDDQGAKDDWLRVAHITRDLKKLAKRVKLPILINTQADKNTSKKTGPELGSIMYTQAIGQDCLPRDTLVLTDTGYKRIQYLENEVFKVFDGERYKKAYCSKTGLKKTTVISYRGNEFVCSPDHKVFVYDNEVDDAVWKKAKDIEPHNDFLLEQNFVTEEGHTHVLRYIPTHNNSMGNPLSIPTEADYDLGYLLGIFIGDGSIKPKEKGQVTVSCGQDKEYAEKCLELVKSKFNLDGKIVPIKSSSSGREELLPTWYSVQFAEWLDYFINLENDKTVKLDFIEMCLQFRLGLFAGLVQSDGSCISQVEFVSSVYSSAKGFNLLCKSLGIATRYDYTKNIHKGKHRVRVMTHDLKKLDITLVGEKSSQFDRLKNSKSTGRLSKPANFIHKICKDVKSKLVVDSLTYKSVCLGEHTGKLSQYYLEKIFDPNFKFMQVDDVTTVGTEQEMWNIQVYATNKIIITNGITSHNSDNVLSLYRDEVMLNDREMGIKVLKQREGTLGKVIVNWDFDTMNFSDIYSEENSGNAVSDNTLSLEDE